MDLAKHTCNVKYEIWTNSAVRPDVGIESNPFLPKVAQMYPQQFHLRIDLFQCNPKGYQTFWLLLLENLLRKLSKIDQSGHTETNLRQERFGKIYYF